MTQINKTELQEALDFFRGYNYENSHLLNALYKAAQSYADLPEKIEGMKRTCDYSQTANPSLYHQMDKQRNSTIDDILNLLKEGV